MPCLANIQQSAVPGLQRIPFLLPEEVRWLQWHEGEVSQVITTIPSVPSAALQEPLEPIQVWQQAGASTVYVPAIAIRWLESLYIFRKPEEVSQFLKANPFLVPLLLEAHGQIENYFGPHPTVALEVITDPEAMDDRELFAFICTSLPPDEALVRLDRLDEEWWLDAMDRAEGKFCIHVEFS